MSRILVVDDEQPVRKMICSIFKFDPYEFIEASNGEEAMQICNDTELDLLITDIVMPEKHGIDLIMEVSKKFPKLPVIAISGGGGVTGRFDYLEIAELVGANNILRKPFGTNELRNLVKNILDD